METAAAGLHAELDEVWARDGQIRFVGTLPESLRDRSWWLRLTPREPVPLLSGWLRVLHPVQRMRMSLSLPPSPYEVAVGERFEAEIPITDLTLPLPVLSAEWDAHLVSGSIGLRLGRHCGVPLKANAITFPWQRVAGQWPCKVRPRYTGDDHLVLESRRTR
ncbi:hypothetical protein J4573_34240 [Actinomadura barringtoniae]|uniref:Uncharacterized protein n=1 Tax=Actinomadura barringtoniae TaxID=1427535 RepID=A0A939PH64_9ACTN|nr:hypothetical protein [Actinomadura barringtoniae]MBO2452192.1 hypothetical protein [Actinomadura barringtoniae]